MPCPSCGRDTPAEARFCPSCGQALALARGEERRVVTAVFADVVGFTSLAENLDPERVKRLVERVVAALRADVAAFGGVVDKVVGDGVIALFGAPVAHEDDAERAVRAALRMHESVAALAVDRPIQLRVGVNTGEVLTGSVSPGTEYTAMGDVVNLASRLQQVAPVGGVAVGPATHAATQAVIAYELLGTVTVKGREEAVTAWVAVAPLAPPGRRPSRSRSPLVGRDTEVHLLIDSLRLVDRHDRPLCAVIEGEGGVGKSRLLEEVIEEAADRFEAVVLEGRCVPYGAPGPWWPLATALAAHLGIADAAPAEAEAAIGAELARLGVEPSRRALVVEGLLSLLGHPTRLDAIDPTRAREELERSFATLIEASARQALTIVALADLQWADLHLIEVLGRLVARLAAYPFAVVTTSRPDQTVPWPPSGGRNTTLVLRLDPLDEPSAARLADLLLPAGAPVEVRQQLLDRSGGNPLFLEELAAVAGTAEASEGSLPGTLRGLVAARLDALSPAERAAVDNAAVLGPSGNVVALEAFAMEMGQPFDPTILRALAGADLLEVDGDHWAFRSELVREVAYATLTKAARAQRHAGVAENLTATFGERPERAEQIAFHWAAAADLVADLGPVALVPGDVHERAVASLLRAVRWHDRQQLHPATERLATRALGLLADDHADPRRRELHLLRSRARAEQRLLPGATADAMEALALAEAAGDLPGQAAALTALAVTERLSGALAAADQHLAAALSLARQAGDARGIVQALRERGLTAMFAGRYDQADEFLAEAEADLESLDDPQGRAWVDQHRAWVAFMAGDASTAEERLSRAATTFEALGDRGGLAWVQGLLAWLRFQQGRPAEAEQLGLAVQAEARSRGATWADAMMTTLVACVRLWAGRLEEAAELARDALAAFEAIDDGFGIVQSAEVLGRAEVAAGRLTRGLAMVGRALQLAAENGMDEQARTAAAGTAAHAGEAARALREADLAAGTTSAAARAEAAHAAAVALLQLGEPAAALTRLAPAGSVDAREGADALSAAGPEVGAYGLAVRAMVLGANGRGEAAAALAELTIGSARGTYLDQVMAWAALASARSAEGRVVEALEAVDRAEAIVASAGDRPAGVFTAALRAALDPGEEAGVELARRTAALPNGGGGWPMAASVLARAGRPASAIIDEPWSTIPATAGPPA